MSICIIPARGGSKRIPNKNIKIFCGKPMIHWAIEAALQSSCFEHVIVSTDSDAISEVAKKAGATVPFKRPVELSDDHTATQAVIQHAISWMFERHPELNKPTLPVCCLYATAPFAQPQDIQQALSLLVDAEYVMPVTSFAFPVQRAARIVDNNALQMLHPEHFNTRSQDLEEVWHDAGQFYWAKAAAWLNELPPYTLKTAPLKLPRWRVQDIDTPEDWQRAEALFSALGMSCKAAA